MTIRKLIIFPLCWAFLTCVPLSAFCQAKVVVVPLGADEPNRCFILGKPTECVADGEVRVPIGLDFVCDTDPGITEEVFYKQAFQFVELSLTESVADLILVRFIDTGFEKIALAISQEPGSRTLFAGETGGTMSMPMEICEIPTADTVQPFILGDFAWTVTPVLSKTDISVTLDELIFTRTAVPIGPFEADDSSGEAVFISVDTDNDTFSARVGDSNSSLSNEGIKFEYSGMGEATFSAIGNVWDSVSNTGPTLVADFPPGTEFTSTLVSGGATYELKATVGESNSATITVDELTVTRQ